MTATYAIGIDLGTTHCALAYIDRDLSEGEEVALQRMMIPQSTAPGEVEKRALLPSFLYLPHAQEFSAGATALPWNSTPTYVVGELARRQGVKTPDRVVSSAKSWLGHAGVDRHAAILPTNPPEDVIRLSPVKASMAYLKHLRDAWDAANPRDPFTDQDITLTVPASFDPAARELTVEAAQLAGYKNLTLLEEPQAALYSWIQNKGESWRDELEAGDLILVVDVGGGTTDFSLIAAGEEDGTLALKRIAVGEHILLGGDNMDLALAYTVKAKFQAKGKSLEPWQLQILTHACRAAKETLFRGEADAVPIVVPGRGSKLIGGTLRSELTRDEVLQIVLEGFFPAVEESARPKRRQRAALTELGLPYAQDAGITRHLAAFLGRQHGALDGLNNENDTSTLIRPTALLLNGGVLKAPAIAERISSVLTSWAGDQDAPRLLKGADLDSGVARGAAYYRYAKDGGGVRIHGGLAQAFYVGVETSMPAVPGIEPEVNALCVAPFGLSEGSEPEPLPQELGLVVGEPVRFRFFASSTRRDDVVGTLLRTWTDEDLSELGAIEASLPGDDNSHAVVPVRLQARVTELGTLVLEALPRDGGEPYRVELEVRD